MIYLFSQIAISLALAAIVGGAAGWLAHRARAGKQIRSLQQVVGRQQQHVNEAQTEVSIISGDFDDLKQQADTEISALKQDNQKIPALHQNLEKSQLLVRQLMQQHKAELDELTEENEKLLEKSKLVEEREQAVKRLQADLESKKQQASDTATSTDDETSVTSEADQTELPLTDTDKATTTASAMKTDPTATTSSAKDKQAGATQAGTKNADAEQAHSDEKSETQSRNSKTITTASAYKNVVVSGDSQGVQASSKLNGKADNSDTRKKRAKKSTSTTRLPLSANSIAAEPNDASNDEVSDETRETVATSRQQASKANQTDDAKAATAESSKAPLPSAAETEAELKALRDQLAEDAPKPLSSDVLEVTASTASSTIKKSSASTAKSKSAGTKTAAGKTTAGKKGKTSATAKKDRPHKLSETEVDDDELTRLFDPVEQHDDLKQIFGIGPVTEKTLNKLGITAYSQLAELKQHDIEKIANALQIFPGRIERDNWVGSARAQLEEVLEDL